MALTNSEKQRVIELLERTDTAERTAILESAQTFADWLERSARQIWETLRNALKQVAEQVAEFLDGLLNAFLG